MKRRIIVRGNKTVIDRGVEDNVLQKGNMNL